MNLENPRNVGEALLLGLKKLGVEWFFANPGTEFVSIIQGFEDLPPGSVPRPVLAPHEFLAVSMAYGCFLATQKPQAIMTHANVGAANALIGLIGCARMNIPVLFFSGMTSHSERRQPGRRDKLIHWSQDTRDQGSIFREYVKWEIELLDPGSVFDVLERAYAIAMTPPFGPVAIKVSRDVLAAEGTGTLQASVPITIGPPAPDRTCMEQIWAWLDLAEKPIVVTNRLGQDPSLVTDLIQSVERHAMGVVTPEDFYLSFPANHPQHLGFRQGSALREADLIFVVDTDAPWYPLEDGPSEAARVVHVGPDPLFTQLPLRSHKGDVYLCSSLSAFLSALNCKTPARPRLDSRLSWVRSKKLPSVNLDDTNLSAATVSATLSEFLTDDIVLVNELSLVPDALNCRFPGQYFRSGSASPLGWGLGCALGLALGNRQKTVIAAIGDGSFYLSPMLASWLIALQQQLPIIVIILNNESLGSIVSTVAGFYGRPEASFPLTSLASPHMRLENCADIASGIGFRVQSRRELQEALQQALYFSQHERRPSVINVCLTKERCL